MRSFLTRFLIVSLLGALSSISTAQASRLGLSFQTCDQAEAMRASRLPQSDATAQGIALFNFSINKAQQSPAPERSEIEPGPNNQIVESAGGFNCSRTSSRAQLIWNGCDLPSRGRMSQDAHQPSTSRLAE
jgi:hypothetical protein